jgi:hypothetical protein
MPAIASRSPRNSRATASSPTTLTTVHKPPKEATLRATFAAPPGKLMEPVTDSTGTGLSGEIRFTCPDMNRSSMTSPMQSTRIPLSLSVMVI